MKFLQQNSKAYIQNLVKDGPTITWLVIEPSVTSTGFHRYLSYSFITIISTFLNFTSCLSEAILIYTYFDCRKARNIHSDRAK